MDELPFPKVRKDHPGTAWDAASSAAPKAPMQRVVLLAALRIIRDECDNGMTDEEMQESFKMNPNTQRPRRVELVEAGKVEDSGEHRKTRSGRNAIVWRAT